MRLLDRLAPTARDRRALLAGAGIALLFAALLGAWTLRPPLVGLANNGDWYRYTCPVDLVPRPDVTFGELPEGLFPGECPPGLAAPYDSSFLLALRGAASIDGALTGPPVTMRFLAAGWSAIATLGWGWLGFELVRGSRRPLVPGVATAGAAVVAADVSFTAYFASGYAEAAIFSLAPVLVAGVVHLSRARRPSWLAVATVVVVGAFVTTTKAQMALTGLLLVGAVVVARRARVPLLGVAAGGVLALACAVYAVGFLADEAYEEANEVNLVFTAALVEADDPASFLEDLGVPPAQARQLAGLEGAGYWPIENGPASSPAYPAFEENVDRGAVLGRIASEPSIGVAMVETAIGTLEEPRLDHLANHADPDADGFLADRPAPASALLGAFAALPWFLVPAVWAAALAAALWAAWSSRDEGARTAAAVLALVVATAVSQTLLSVADGYYELTKHLVVGHYAHAVGLAALLGGLAGRGASEVLERRSVRAGTTDGPGPGTAGAPAGADDVHDADGG